MIGRGVAVGAVIIALVFAGWVWWTRAQLEAARADLESARAQLEGVKASARFWQEQAARDADAAALDSEFQKGAGADAALSDYLRRGAGRVWP